MAGHIATAARDDWCTPEWIVERVRKAFGGVIDLDPCSNANALVHARANVALPMDGLALPWIGLRTFINPPYGRGIVKWIAKAASTYARVNAGTEIIMLVPAAVGTKFWHKYVWPVVPAICFFDGRVRFVGAETGAPMDTCVLYYGRNVEAFREAFRDVGRIVFP